MKRHLKGSQFELLGLDLVQKWRVEDLVIKIKSCVMQRCKLTISCIGFHVSNTMARDPNVKETFKALDIVLADGVAIVWASRILGRALTIENRIGGDITVSLVYREAVTNGWGIYFLGGGTLDTAQRAAVRLMDAHPGLKIVGTHPGYLSSDAQKHAVVEDINRSGAVIVLVGMGQPRQEGWIVANQDRISALIFIAVGGYFDHVLKCVDCYPSWVYKCRLNWAYRVLREPRRLWKRYTLGFLTFFLRVLWGRIARVRATNL